MTELWAKNAYPYMGAQTILDYNWGAQMTTDYVELCVWAP